ncbi:MAG: PAS domain S-box protein [Chlorobium sp.]|nr:MAG: PAS domain S-box protein [Chlorobium sp.]
MHYRNFFSKISRGYACCSMVFQDDRPVDYTYDVVNPAFEQMIGHQGVEGRKMTEVIPGLLYSNPEFFERLGRVVESGITESFEFYLHELDKWLDVSAYSEHKGELVLVLSPVQTMTTGIWEWNPDNGKMIWSDELRTLFGLSEHSCEATYDVWLQFVAPEERELTQKTIRNAAAKSVKFNIVCHVNPADGSARRLMIQGFPSRNADGVVSRYMGISIDITESKKEDIIHRINTGDLDTILKSSTEPFCSLALDGTVLDANKDFYEILDIESNNLKGHNFHTLFSCELQKHRKANFELVYYTGEPVHFQDKCSKTHCNANYSGECIYQISVYPVYDKSGKIDSLAIFIVKSNERNKSEKAQRKLDQKYQTLIAASPDSIITTDLQGNITSISDMGLDLYGTNDRAELIGMPFSILVHSDDIKILNKILEIALYDGLIQNREILLKKKNNMIYSAEISAALIQDFDGAPSSYMIIIRDISQRKIIESELFHAKRLISLGEMASGIAHEIYQPINNIGLIVDNLLMDADKYNWDSKKAIKIKSEKIFENILRVQTIIDNIRSFSSTDKNYISSVVNINQSIRNALLMVSEQCKNKSITLDFKPRQDNLSVTGNMYKFEQVILNLIKNSIDALEEIKQDNAKSFEMKILVQSYYEKDSIVVTVEDNGIGISQENIEYIMHPFYTTKDSGKGTGLGLSISYRIIKEMNGDIKIKSSPRNGTCVIITLPHKGNKNEQ